jgi:hypothetical protein
MENTHTQWQWNTRCSDTSSCQLSKPCMCTKHTSNTHTRRYRYASKIEHFKTLNDPQTLKFVDHFITV